jgi:hypothetical protein
LLDGLIAGDKCLIDKIAKRLPVDLKVKRTISDRHKNDLRMYQLKKDGAPQDEELLTLWQSNSIVLAQSFKPVLSKMSSGCNIDHYTFAIFKNANSLNIPVNTYNCEIKFFNEEYENLWPGRDVKKMLMVSFMLSLIYNTLITLLQDFLVVLSQYRYYITKCLHCCGGCENKLFRDLLNEILVSLLSDWVVMMQKLVDTSHKDSRTIIERNAKHMTTYFVTTCTTLGIVRKFENECLNLIPKLINKSKAEMEFPNWDKLNSILAR